MLVNSNNSWHGGDSQNDVHFGSAGKFLAVGFEMHPKRILTCAPMEGGGERNRWPPCIIR